MNRPIRAGFFVPQKMKMLKTGHFEGFYVYEFKNGLKNPLQLL